MTAIETVNQAVPNTEESEFFVVRTIKKASDAYTETLKGYNDKYIRGIAEKGKDFGEGLKKDARILADRFTEKGKDLREGVKKDTRMLADRFVEKGKAVVPDLPFLNTLEEKVLQGVNRFMERANMPTKRDIETLTLSMDALDKRVDALSREHSAV